MISWLRHKGLSGFLGATGLLLVTALLLSGCLSRPSLARQNFTFPVPSLNATAASTSGKVLSIRRLTVAAPFAGQSFVYRTGECSFEQDPYAQFLVPPQESLAEPIRAYLRNSGRFSAVTEPGSGAGANRFLEVYVTQLYGDLRDPKAPAAVLSIRFLFFNPEAGTPPKLVLEKEYSRRIPIKARTAAAVMDGWAEALKQIMEALPSDERS